MERPLLIYDFLNLKRLLLTVFKRTVKIMHVLFEEN